MSQQQDIQQWMEDVANKRPTKKKLIFDRKTKRMISVPVNDPRVGADEAIDFDPIEAKRYLLF